MRRQIALACDQRFARGFRRIKSLVHELAMKRNLFSDPVVGCLALVPYSAAFPACEVSLQIGILPLVAVLLADAATATALYGFLHPDRVFILCGVLWASFIIPNMVYVACLAQESLLTTGVGYHWGFLLLATAAVFLVALAAQRAFRRSTQNAITAITNAYGAVASFSYIWTFFSGEKESAFDILSFTSYPSQFSWQSQSDVTFFVFFLLLILLGLALDYRRDLVQLSPGFGDAKDEPLVPMELGGGPGIDLSGTQRRGERERPPAAAEAAEPFLIFPEGKEQPGGIRRTEPRVESDFDEDSDADSIEQDDDFATKWIDTTRVLTAASLATTVDETSSLMSPYTSPSFAEEEDLLLSALRSRAELDLKGLSALRARDQRRPYL
ncbi:hypothetical protein Esti_004869 [Eimeria stiedai]